MFPELLQFSTLAFANSQHCEKVDSDDILPSFSLLLLQRELLVVLYIIIFNVLSLTFFFHF
jgi:hypothetical protein